MEHPVTQLSQFQSQMLDEGLRELFGETNDELVAALMPLIEWVEVPGGETVLRQGETDRDVYVVISGRLRAYGGVGPRRRRERPGESGRPDQRFLGEVRRGETIGEVSFITGGARMATVIAARDSVLARISRPRLESLLGRFPQIALGMARIVVSRIVRSEGGGGARRRPTNLCLLPITPGVDPREFGRRLVENFPVIGEAVLVTSSSLEERAGVPGLAGANTSQGDLYRQLTRVLDELEAQHGSVIYVPDGNLESEWSMRCLRMADRVLLLADAQASPAVSAAESLLLGAERRVTTAEQVLVLLHSDDAAIPAGTEAWLDQRPKGSIVAHLHIRPSRNEDMARLARTQSARAIGLVLCGGGARCISQLGVYKALQEHGIAVDYVGGSGLGSAMGALIALGRPADEIIAYAREAFTANPTGDVSLMPVTSLIKGRQLKGIIDDAIEHLARKGARIEDTWKTYFCVASNYSKACEVVLRRGPLAKSIRASAAVPGLLPPVPIDGDLMVDGGAFNHYPTDVMWRSGTAKIIGVTLSRDASPGGDLDEVPGAWTLAWDRVTGRRRQFRIPTLMAILMNSTTLASASREPIASSLVDLEFTPNLPSVGLLDWQSFDHAVKVGHQLAAKKLAGMTREELAPYRGA